MEYVAETFLSLSLSFSFFFISVKFSTKEKAEHHDNTIVAKKKGMSITMSVYLKSQEKMMIEIFDFYSKKQMMDPCLGIECFFNKINKF
jgi:hypothetical protein